MIQRSIGKWRIGSMLFGIVLLSPVRHAFPQQTANNRVSGRVVSSKDQRPLAHAKVTLGRERTSDTMADVITGEDGRFVFDAVPAGRFRLTGSAAGFLPAAYQEHEGFATAIVTGAGLVTDGLQLELQPGAAIEGRLTDESGDPIANGNIQLYRESTFGAERVSRMRSAQTNDNGEYEVENLPPGRYFLSATATPWYAVHPRPEPSANMPYRLAVDSSLDVTYPLVFYPNALESTDASPIVLRGGDEFIANMQLQPMHALTITIHAAPREPNAPNTPATMRFSQLTRTVFGNEEPAPQMIENDGNGDQRLAGIAPGQYHLREIQQNGGHSGRNFDPIRLTNESITVDRSSVSSANLSTVQATVHTAGGGPLPTGFQLHLTDGYTAPLVGKADAQGIVKLSDVVEGDYQVRTSSSGRVLSVIHLTVNGHAVPDKRLHVGAAGGTITADVIVAAGAINVEGVAQRDGKPVAGSMLVLVPADGDTSEELFRRDQSDLDGGFVFPNVVPGNYLLVAIDDGWPLRVTDTVAMQRYLLHAVPVTVSATSSKTIHLSEPVVTQQR